MSIAFFIGLVALLKEMVFFSINLDYKSVSSNSKDFNLKKSYILKILPSFATLAQYSFPFMVSTLRARLRVRPKVHKGIIERDAC